MDRVRFIKHEGKQVLLVDYSNCTRQALLDILEERERVALAQPKDSLLTLADVTGAQFTKDVIERVKMMAVRERDRVKRAALVGIESVPKVFVDSVSNFSAREYFMFSTREDALNWLVSEGDPLMQTLGKKDTGKQ